MDPDRWATIAMPRKPSRGRKMVRRAQPYSPLSSCVATAEACRCDKKKTKKTNPCPRCHAAPCPSSTPAVSSAAHGGSASIGPPSSSRRRERSGAFPGSPPWTTQTLELDPSGVSLRVAQADLYWVRLGELMPCGWHAPFPAGSARIRATSPRERTTPERSGARARAPS